MSTRHMSRGSRSNDDEEAPAAVEIGAVAHSLSPPPAPPLPPQQGTADGIATSLQSTGSAASRDSPAQDSLSRIARWTQSVSPSSSATSRPQRRRASEPDSGRRRSAAPNHITHKTGIPIAALDASPDRTRAVLAGREILKIIRVGDDSCVEEHNLRATITAFASTHETAGPLGSIRLQERLAASSVKWSHGGFDKTIATAAANGQVVLYDLEKTGLEWVRLHEHHRQVHALDFNPVEATWLLSASQDATVKLWDLRAITRSEATISHRATFTGNSDAVRDVRWSPTNPYEFAIATDSGVLQRWDVRKDAAPLVRTKAHERACRTIDWHPDGKHLVSAGADKDVKVWDFSSVDRRMKPVMSLRAPQAVVQVRWRPPMWRAGDNQPGSWQSTEIVTAFDQEDPRICVWDFCRPFAPSRVLDRYDLPPTSLLWQSDRVLWSVGEHGVFVKSDISSFREHAYGRASVVADITNQGDVLALVTPRANVATSLDRLQQTPPLTRQLSSDISPSLLHDSPTSPLRRRGKQSGVRSIAGSNDTTPEMGSAVGPVVSFLKGLDEIAKVPETLHILSTQESRRIAQIKFLANHLLPFRKSFQETCLHNAEVAASCGRRDLAAVFVMIGQLGQNELRAKPQRTAKPWHLSTVLGRYVWRYLYMQQDVQVAVYMLVNFGGFGNGAWLHSSKFPGRGDLASAEFRAGLIMQHVSLLRKLGCHVAAARLVNQCVRGKMIDVAEADGAIGFWCPHCGKAAGQRAGTNHCTRCGQASWRCAVCMGDYQSDTKQTSGLFTWCQCCGHAFHDKCMMEWFGVEDDQEEEHDLAVSKSAAAMHACPVLGCGCTCLGDEP